MRRHCWILLFFLTNGTMLYAQEYDTLILSEIIYKKSDTSCTKDINITYDTTDEIQEIGFIVAQEMPVFQGGGLEEFYTYIQNHIEYPEETVEGSIGGTVYVHFVVGLDGCVKDVSVFRGIDAVLDAEAIRVVKSSPVWEPGKVRDKPVNVSFVVPVKFVIQ